MTQFYKMLQDKISVFGSTKSKPKVYACKGQEVELLHKNPDGTVVLKNIRTGDHFPARFNHLEEIIPKQ